MKKQQVAITGDLTMDWNIARIPGGKRGTAEWNARDWTRAWSQRGDIALVTDLINALSANSEGRGQLLSTSDPLMRDANR